jgi:hypothetical protein
MLYAFVNTNIETFYARCQQMMVSCNCLVVGHQTSFFIVGCKHIFTDFTTDLSSSLLMYGSVFGKTVRIAKPFSQFSEK